jgi:Sap, sulfolipid-1-addressing protein
VTIEIVVLGLASALRPSSLVAVYALVRERAPSRLMAAYVIAGLAFAFALGAAVLLVFRGIELQAGTHRTRGIAEIAAGALATGFGAALLLGGSPLTEAAAPRASQRLERARQREFTTRTAAAAGVATHIPGLLFVLALDLIVSQEPDLPNELIQVGIYDALWFAPPILVLAICILDPEAARRGVHRFEQWAGAHARTILVVVSFGIGAWLLLDGARTI